MVIWAGVSKNIETSPSDVWLKFLFNDPSFKKLPVRTQLQLKREKNVLVNNGTWDDKDGDCRQEIVFIGDKNEMDEKFIIEQLDHCLLTETELKMDQEEWFNFPDPFPDWFEQEEDGVCELNKDDDEEGDDEEEDDEQS
eukprot:TRINITY_DN1075_c0_g2_i2.p2 TRINITY_DN1075_c0_g2~~TRINITY_DN1075_c0_g2_i2.p2  ORF type:complete len:139 (+),score=60.42 TRINITY_DN1075_c0_g2_i2:1171-1587(+)